MTVHGMLLPIKGNINAEIVINAGGLWAREVGQLAGINLPVQPMEHHYLITETIPEIEALPEVIKGCQLEQILKVIFILDKKVQGMLLRHL